MSGYRFATLNVPVVLTSGGRGETYEATVHKAGLEHHTDVMFLGGGA